MLARQEGIILPILLGDAAAIQAAAQATGADLSGSRSSTFQAIRPPPPQPDRLAHDGRASAVMKGHLHTGDLLKPMLDRACGSGAVSPMSS